MYNSILSRGELNSAQTAGQIRQMCRTDLNFRVAQHTTNYNAWAKGNTNNWETLPYDSCPSVVYAIVD